MFGVLPMTIKMYINVTTEYMIRNLLVFIQHHSYASTSGIKVSSECITRSRVAGGRVLVSLV